MGNLNRNFRVLNASMTDCRYRLWRVPTVTVRGCYLVRSPYGISPQHPRGTTWYARTRRARQGSARREGAASGDPRVRFDRGLFDRFLRASAIMVMDEREPILRGAKAPAHAQSQSYRCGGDPRRSRRRTRLARRGHRTRPEFQSPRVPRQRGAARGDRPRRRRRVGRRPVRRERRLIGRAERERGERGQGGEGHRDRYAVSRSLLPLLRGGFQRGIRRDHRGGLRRRPPRSLALAVPFNSAKAPSTRGHPVRTRTLSSFSSGPTECSPRRCSACSTTRMRCTSSARRIAS